MYIFALLESITVHFPGFKLVMLVICFNINMYGVISALLFMGLHQWHFSARLIVGNLPRPLMAWWEVVIQTPDPGSHLSTALQSSAAFLLSSPPQFFHTFHTLQVYIVMLTFCGFTLLTCSASLFSCVYFCAPPLSADMLCMYFILLCDSAIYVELTVLRLCHFLHAYESAMYFPLLIWCFTLVFERLF